jgi:hypothetical protein
MLSRHVPLESGLALPIVHSMNRPNGWSLEILFFQNAISTYINPQ